MKRTKLPKSLTTVTWFSKILAVLLFFIFLLAAFKKGMDVQRQMDSLEMQATPAVTLMPTK